jgi:hypothetical protein
VATILSGNWWSTLFFGPNNNLISSKIKKPAAYNGNNDETFKFDKKNWPEAIHKLDDILTQLENTIAAADEATLQKWYTTIANISTHNAYHTGQIIFIRKLQGSWNLKKKLNKINSIPFI